ncbi:MAG: arginyltransferase [Rhodospirillaceae bacterium]|nr:arginyltransferase [Rhodospirillaceae bacterium]
MSLIQPDVTRLHHFFRSGPMPCPYLAGRVERKLFTRLSGADASDLNSQLSTAGFRRSHDIVYRPVCQGCVACVPVRIPARRLKLNRTQRRINKANVDLAIVERPPHATPEQYQLFMRYQRDRHGESDMARMSRADFEAMIEEGNASARLFEFRRPDNVLLGAMLADRLADGFSAVYSFFEPGDTRRSLGTYMVLALVQMALHENTENVYLGYWIADCRKMSYKTSFQPLEALGPGGWHDMTPAAAAPVGPPAMAAAEG